MQAASLSRVLAGFLLPFTDQQAQTYLMATNRSHPSAQPPAKVSPSSSPPTRTRIFPASHNSSVTDISCSALPDTVLLGFATVYLPRILQTSLVLPNLPPKQKGFGTQLVSRLFLACSALALSAPIGLDTMHDRIPTKAENATLHSLYGIEGVREARRTPGGRSVGASIKKNVVG